MSEQGKLDFYLFTFRFSLKICNFVTNVKTLLWCLGNVYSVR